jgi:hypothetical protein
MIGAMLGAITSLVGIGLQAQAQQDQLNFQYAQFNWQKQRAREQDRFAQAGRQDAYGNETYFDSGLNKWMTKLTPMQKRYRRLVRRNSVSTPKMRLRLGRLRSHTEALRGG